ncbi:MAG: hypothetical protein LBI33_02375 [Propionibacteriaceae bacterium]|jgi:hypothetical protein|nr:hypothetical protein [Propionibacteriaceae bacterium]
MDASGPIFAVLVIACLFYLVPRGLSWRIPKPADIDQETPLHLTMKTVHAGHREVVAEPAAEVSTLLMRRAGRRAAYRLARRAEKRRRAIFVVLLLISLATVPFAVMRLAIQWWVPLAALGVVLAWVAFSQIEARRVNRQLDAIVADKELGDQEKTIAVALHEDTLPAEPTVVVGPNGDAQPSLWDPITVVPPTYMSKPTAARTVRTIDLGAGATRLPVTDDGRTADGGRAVAV